MVLRVPSLHFTNTLIILLVMLKWLLWQNIIVKEYPFVTLTFCLRRHIVFQDRLCSFGQHVVLGVFVTILLLIQNCSLRLRKFRIDLVYLIDLLISLPNVLQLLLSLTIAPRTRLLQQ